MESHLSQVSTQQFKHDITTNTLTVELFVDIISGANIGDKAFCINKVCALYVSMTQLLAANRKE